MQIETLNERVSCSDAQARLLVFDPSVIQSVLLQNVTGGQTVEIGQQGVEYGAGYPITAGSSLAITWQDFAPEVRARGPQMVEIWGICSAGLTTTVQVFGFARR